MVELTVSLVVILFLVRFLVYYSMAYPTALVAGLVLAQLTVTHLIMRWLFPIEPIIHKNFQDYLWSNQFFLVTLPFLISVLSVYCMVLSFVRDQSWKYSWEGSKLLLSRGEKLAQIEFDEIKSWTSATNLVTFGSTRLPKIFWLKTEKGFFAVDELLERDYWDSLQRPSFWSISEGIEKAKQNMRFSLSQKRLGDFLKKNRLKNISTDKST